MNINEKWQETSNKGGFWKDDNDVRHDLTYSDANKEDIFKKHLKLRGLRAMWAYNHGFGPRVVINTKFDGNNKELSKWKARARYFGDESYYASRYFYLKLPQYQRPVITLIRVSNHPIEAKTWEDNHSSGNIGGVPCDTCLDIIINYDKRDDFHHVPNNVINDVQVRFDPFKASKEQNAKIDAFIKDVQSDHRPVYSLDDLKDMFGIQNVNVVVHGTGKMRSNQFEIPSYIRKQSLSLPPWTVPDKGYPSEINFVDCKDNGTITYKGKEYTVLNFDGVNYAADFDAESEDGKTLPAYPIKKNGNLSLANKVIVKESKNRKNAKVIYINESQFHKLFNYLI